MKSDLHTMMMIRSLQNLAVQVGLRPQKQNLNMPDNKEFYQIRVKGRLDQSWSAWFDNMALTFEKGETTISGEVADQAALHGLLTKIRDLGLMLLDVKRVESDRDKPMA